MASWKDAGQDYIYHIYVGSAVYVGQSKAKSPGSRLKYRLRAPFSFTTIKDEEGIGSLGWSNNYDIPEMAELIRKKGLKNVQAVFFKPPYYGVDPILLESFKAVFKPTSKDESASISNLNAAEILHILYFQNCGKKLFNRSMGGTNGSLSIITKDNRVIKKAFTYTMSPKTAHALFFANVDTVARLKQFTDYFNKIVFTDEWKSFYNQVSSRSSFEERKDYKIVSNEWTKATYDKLLYHIGNKIKENIFSPDELKAQLRKNVMSWVRGKKAIFSTYLKDFLSDQDIQLEQRDIDLIQIREEEVDKLVEYIVNAIYNQLINQRALKKEFREKFQVKKVSSNNPEWNKFKKDKGNLVLNNANNLKKRKFEIINISTLISTKGLTHSKQTWWSDFSSWSPQNGVLVDEDLKKEIAFSVFKSIYNEIADKNFYASAQYGKYNETYSFVHGRDSTLSAKIHEKYRDLGLSFVEDQWRTFYGRMVSLYINKKDAWIIEQDEEKDREIAYRRGQKIDTPAGSRFVAHVAHRPKFWETTSISDIEVY